MPTIPYYQHNPRFGHIYRVLISPVVHFMRTGTHCLIQDLFSLLFELLYLSLSSVSFSIFLFSAVRSSISALQVFSLIVIFSFCTKTFAFALRLLTIALFLYFLIHDFAFFLFSVLFSFYRFRSFSCSLSFFLILSLSLSLFFFLLIPPSSAFRHCWLSQTLVFSVLLLCYQPSFVLPFGFFVFLNLFALQLIYFCCYRSLFLSLFIPQPVCFDF